MFQNEEATNAKPQLEILLQTSKAIRACAVALSKQKHRKGQRCSGRPFQVGTVAMAATSFHSGKKAVGEGCEQ